VKVPLGLSLQQIFTATSQSPRDKVMHIRSILRIISIILIQVIRIILIIHIRFRLVRILDLRITCGRTRRR
jgi:hypothetical protein